MPVTDSRVRTGSLIFDPSGTPSDFSCQPTAVSIQPQNTDASADFIEVLCGDEIPSDANTSAELEANLVFTAIQDFTDSAGLVAYSWLHNGEEMEFTWQPTSDPADSWLGTVKVQALEVGGEVNTRLTNDAQWRITALTLPTTLGGSQVIPAP